MEDSIGSSTSLVARSIHSQMPNLPSPHSPRKGEIDSWRQPLFAELFRGIRLRSTVYFRPELRSPWGIGIANRGAIFHIVVRGSCLLQVDGVADPVTLSAGDFVVITRGDAHTMRDARPTQVADVYDLAKQHKVDRNGMFRCGGKGPLTRLVCGGMQFENGVTNPLLAVLPSLLHVKATKQVGRTWLRLTLKHVLEELNSSGAGAAEVVTRLADILFIQAVRAYFEENADSAEFGWLAAVRDEQIGKALALLHAHPTVAWTIASLARRVALSRSAFADKFTELIGEPPLRYLTRLRINAAAQRLRANHDKLKTIAAAAGYESVTAFTRAFRRHMGMTPGEYRAVRRLKDSAP